MEDIILKGKRRMAILECRRGQIIFCFQLLEVGFLVVLVAIEYCCAIMWSITEFAKIKKKNNVFAK